MKNEKDKYDVLGFIEAVKLKLSPVHSIGKTVPIGKIRYSFEVDGISIVLLKNKEKDKKTGNIKRKTIVTCSDMFPAVIYNPDPDDFLYDDKNVNYVVDSIDAYLMELVGYDSVKAAICSRYDVLKWLLLPIYIYNFKDQEAIATVQSNILYELIYSYCNENSSTNQWKNNDKGTLLCFIGKNMDTDKQDRAFIVISQAQCTNIFVVRYENNKLIGIDDPDKEIAHYIIQHEYNELQYVNIFKKILKNYYDFSEYSLSFSDDEPSLNQQIK